MDELMIIKDMIEELARSQPLNDVIGNCLFFLGFLTIIGLSILFVGGLTGQSGFVIFGGIIFSVGLLSSVLSYNINHEKKRCVKRIEAYLYGYFIPNIEKEDCRKNKDSAVCIGFVEEFYDYQDFILSPDSLVALDDSANYIINSFAEVRKSILE